MAITIVFSGMCAFKPVDIAKPSECTVFLPSEREAHRAVLAIKTDFIPNDKTLSNWAPDLLGHVHNESTGAYEQVGYWLLGGVVLRPDAGNSGVSFVTKDLLLMRDFHGTADTVTRPAMDIAMEDPMQGVVMLNSGEIKASKEDEVSIWRNGAEEKVRDIAYRMVWTAPDTGNAMFFYGAKGNRITVMDGAIVGITNEASLFSNRDKTVPLAHFPNYYDLISLDKNDSQLTLFHNYADVYDCVPPIVLP